MRNLVVKWNSHERYILTNNCARRQRKRVLTTRWWSVLMHRSASAPVANDNSCAVDAASSSVKSVDELIHCQRLHAAAQIDVCQRQRRQWWRRAEAGDPRGGRRSIDWWHFDDEWISFIISLCRRFAVAHHRLHACQSTLSFARSLSLSLSDWGLQRSGFQWCRADIVAEPWLTTHLLTTELLDCCVNLLHAISSVTLCCHIINSFCPVSLPKTSATGLQCS